MAVRKVRKLLQAGARVFVVAPEVRPELERMDVEIRRRAYGYGDLRARIWHQGDGLAGGERGGRA